VEVVAAKAKKMVQDIEAQAGQTTVFKGEVKSQQTLCSKCGKPAGEGKFCGNCGEPLALNSCPKCQAAVQPGTKFCPECGSKL
jgi:predicted amidophosphoribosyltransferase